MIQGHKDKEKTVVKMSQPAVKASMKTRKTCSHEGCTPTKSKKEECVKHTALRWHISDAASRGVPQESVVRGTSLMPRGERRSLYQALQRKLVSIQTTTLHWHLNQTLSPLLLPCHPIHQLIMKMKMRRNSIVGFGGLMLVFQEIELLSSICTFIQQNFILLLCYTRLYLKL